MPHAIPVERVVDLTDSTANVFLNMTPEEAQACVASGDASRVAAIDGQFAILYHRGSTVRLARSIGRPLRYFIAKRREGPLLIASERIDLIQSWLAQESLANQFHPSYTRMAPAHYLVEIALVGCPDPNPTYQRFLAPQRDRWPTDLDKIGREYIGAVAAALSRWLDRIPADAPLGVLFSGGVDSGAVFLLVYHLLLARGASAARLKAFTLSIDGGGADLDQARRFLKPLGLEMFLETIEVDSSEIDLRETVRVIEDYKPLDVQSAAMSLTLCRGIRARYPDWRYLADGDGGDENLKDYPIEDNPELTIRSVLNNRLLYQEGWGIDSVKHSLTYSGGQSRGHVRSYAPARELGFSGYSPYAVPSVIDVAEGIPFIALTDWQPERLYALKGEIVRRGVAALAGLEMPIFPKRRFQHGAAERPAGDSWLPDDPAVYRNAFASLYS